MQSLFAVGVLCEFFFQIKTQVLATVGLLLIVNYLPRLCGCIPVEKLLEDWS